jgi:CubicO group peptidase (beta-lactamase class C family)
MAFARPFALLAALALTTAALAQQPYYPDATWQHRTPEQSGIDAAKLKDAIDFAIAAESKNPRDLALNHYQTFGREPFGYAIGPIKDRGDMTGIVVHKGYIVAEWGEPKRVDMTHSVTKSMLSSIVGVAFDRGLIRSIDDPVGDYVPPIQLFNPTAGGNKADRMGRADFVDLFDTPHNRTITWNHMLRQTSDWEGTLWGKPDWADRPSDKPAEWLTRKRAEPGTTWKYNDTRVNVLALATLNVWRRPLPQVLKETIMDPIGASNTWRWFGYENSFVVLDGTVMQAVTGGGHWGGGMFINAYDMARFGLLTLRGGRWKDRQLLSKQWVEWALTPTPAFPTYGFMNWYNNRDKKLLPSVPASVFMHVGNGTNLVIADPDDDLVVVLRWIDNNKSADEVLKRIIAAIKR